MVNCGIDLADQEDVRRFIMQGASGRTLAPATANRRLSAIRGLARFLQERGEMHSDPTAGMKRVPKKRVRTVAPSARELCAILNALAHEPTTWRRQRDETIIQLFFNTGLRVSELQRLNLDQLDCAGGRIRQAHRKGGDMVDVVLNQAAIKALEQWLKVRPDSSLSAVLTNRRGGRLSVRAIQKHFRQLWERAGVTTPIHPHRVRHAHATALHAAGVSLELIRESMNHTTIAMTQHYIHSDEEELREALDLLPVLTPDGPRQPHRPMIDTSPRLRST